jgi:pimeloyl-ACP methyl ester carboxylesterase
VAGKNSVTAFATAKDGVRLAWERVGEGDPVLLIHGFGSSRVQNWKAPGWYDTLTSAGYSVVAVDCRGHGESDKPHTLPGYRHDEMADDVLAVMDAAGITATHVIGYSMGGLIGIHVLMRYPERVTRLVIGGVGESYFEPPSSSRDRVADPRVRNEIVEALLADDPATITNATARGFRAFADQPGKDRLALAACMRAPPANLPREALARSMRPVLVVCGEKDELTGGPDGLAAAFENGSAVTVPNRDHMTTVGDKVFKAAVLEFLA